jgi:hypothetical protein
MKDLQKLFNERIKRNKFPEVTGKLNDCVTVQLYSPINRTIRQSLFYSNRGLYFYMERIKQFKSNEHFYSSALKSLYDK